MKKGKVFGKAQIALVLMVAALGGAIWLNMRFSSGKYLGEATYVSSEKKTNAVQTSANVSLDEFDTAVREREEVYEQAKDLVKRNKEERSIKAKKVNTPE